jgi:hypothetical protein
VPDLTRFDRGQRTDTISISVDEVQIDAALHDVVNRRCYLQHALIGEKGVRLYSVQLRYVWPSELDLMARLAGSELRNRYGGRKGEPFSGASISNTRLSSRSYH